jgi:hypothetical protein
MKIDVVSPEENFKGISYGEWAAVWTNWLLSEDPDTYYGSDVLFLRGNINYKPTGELSDSPRYIDPQELHNRTRKNGETIYEGISIFVPVMTAYFTIGDVYDGRLVKTEEDLRDFVNKDINQTGTIWATIIKKGNKKANKIVKNLKEYRIESPLFKLTVSDKSPLKDKMETKQKTGIFDAVAGGYYLMIKSLPSGTYRLFFGGKGRGPYYTKSVYDIVVKGKKRNTLVDVSGTTKLPQLKW